MLCKLLYTLKLYRKDRNYLLYKRRDVNRVIDSPIMFV